MHPHAELVLETNSESIPNDLDLCEHGKCNQQPSGGLESG